MEFSWADTTIEVYGSGLLLFHIFCDTRSIAEEDRMPVTSILISAFVAALAASYSKAAISNYVAGIQAWHILHQLPWTLQKASTDMLLSGSKAVAPAGFKCSKCPPCTLQYLSAIPSKLNLTTPRDAAVWACTTSLFWGLGRTCELTTKTVNDFSPQTHVTPPCIHRDQDCQGFQVMVIFIP